MLTLRQPQPNIFGHKTENNIILQQIIENGSDTLENAIANGHANDVHRHTTERPPSSSSDGKEKSPINPAMNTVKKHIETARGVVVPAVKQSIDKYVLPNAKKAGDSAVRGWKAFRRFVRPVVNKAIGGGRAFGERLASMKHWESSNEEEKAEEKKKHEEKVEKREEKKDKEKKKKKKNKKEHKTTVEKKEQKHDEKKGNEAKKEKEELDERKKEQEGHREEATEVISEMEEKLNELKLEDIEKKRKELNDIEQQKDDELRKKKGKMVAVDTENDFEPEAKKERIEWKKSLGPNDFDDQKSATSSSSSSDSDESSE
uniref:Uncharacterized protein n=1 Tax=Globodera rostochiensis TaxID=31243 RepID=A0A914ID73_GLORO